MQRRAATLAVVLLGASVVRAQGPPPVEPKAIRKLADIRMRDVCILADRSSRTYYMVGPGRRAVRIYTSKDLRTWDGPEIVYRPEEDTWGDIPIVGIWAPELHAYKDKFYLFLTFDTRNKLPEQWRDWLSRVTRGSQVLVADRPTGPFSSFTKHSTLPVDMMTLDGTLWVEAGVPYMVFCHEWVQIKDGTVESVRLTDDLSATVGEPTRLFDGSDAAWSKKHPQYGSHVTDGPFLHQSKSGKLFMLWTSGGYTGYTTGIAIADSGKLAGPWRQQAEPLYGEDGGHSMVFTTFEGQLMMVLHAPNDRDARPRLFEMEDTGETLRLVKEFTGE